MLRWLVLLPIVATAACTASHQTSGTGTVGTPVVAGTPALDSDSGVEFETDEPAPSVSVLPHHQVVVVVRVVNHDDERHSFLAKATLLDQQGATITSVATPVTLAGNDGRLVRFSAKNPQDRPIWSVQFEAMPR